jgi:hypothetical protein
MNDAAAVLRRGAFEVRGAAFHESMAEHVERRSRLFEDDRAE